MKPLTTIALGLALIGVGALTPCRTPTPIDVSAAVLAAIARGGASYTLPDGRVELRAPIVIPAGTHNFTLKGGSGTVLVTPSHLDKQAVLVGNKPELSSNWWLTGDSNIKLEEARQGDAYLVARTATACPLGYAVVFDDHRIWCAKGPNSCLNHAEIVEVVKFDPSNWKITLKAGLGREYTGNVRLAPYQSATCAGIRLQGFSVDGQTSDGTPVSEGGVMVGVADDVQILGVHVSHFRSDAIATDTARNVVVAGCTVDGSAGGGAGSGYGFSIYRSRTVLLRSNSATGCRHGFLLHSGTIDAMVQSCSSPNGFDLHGYDERRIIITDCTGDGLDLGNDAWLAPPSDVRVTRCRFTGDIGIHGGTRLAFTSCVFGTKETSAQIGLYSVEAGTTPTVGVPASEQLQDATFAGCTIASGGTCFNDQGAAQYGTVTFTGGSWQSHSTCLDLSYSGAIGSLSLSGVTLTTSSPDHVVQLYGMPRGSVDLKGCQLTGRGSLGIWIRSDVRALVTITGCSYVGGSTFIADDSGLAIVSGNTARQQ